MRVRVLYFGMLKEIAGKDAEELQLPEGSTVADLLDRCAPQVADHRDVLAVALNLEYASASEPLRDGDEVGLLPPVSGGAGLSQKSSARCTLTRIRIDTHSILENLKRPDDGAVCVFDGIVRNQTRGRATTYLDYSAYEEMALQQMEALCRKAVESFAIRDARIVHRLGRLEIGESSVLIAVASAHRAAAMDACRFLIDTLKKTIPIWKKEFFSDGAVWADGEPFPAEICPTGESVRRPAASNPKLSAKSKSRPQRPSSSVGK